MGKIPIRYIQSQQKDQADPRRFRIRDLTSLFDGKDMVQELHRHDFYLILALKNGKGSHEIDFESYKVKADSIFFLRPGQVHQLTLKSGSTGYLVEFDSSFHTGDKDAMHLLRKVSSNNYYSIEPGKFQRLLQVLTYMFEEQSQKKERYLEIIKSNLNIFFIELARENHNNSLNVTNSYAQERLERFLELLEIHVSDHKQASEYADMLNLSPYQLNAITKASLGKTCSELINNYMILESKRNLLGTTNQVNQIAHSLGFEDVSYFIRFFKKQTGQSPEAFRNNFN